MKKAALWTSVICLYVGLFYGLPHLFFCNLNHDIYWFLIGIFQLVGLVFVWEILYETRKKWEGSLLVKILFAILSIPAILVAIAIVAMVCLFIFYYSVVILSFLCVLIGLIMLIGLMGELIDESKYKDTGC